VPHFSLSVALIALSAFLLRPVSAQEMPPTVLVLDQAGPGLVAYANMTAHLRTVLNRETGNAISIYAESLDLSRFQSDTYRKLQSRFLHEKYRDIPVGLIVALGARSLEYAVILATETWPGLPVIFAAVADDAIDKAALRSHVTGQTIRVSLRNSVSAAAAVVPDLTQVALVGDPLQRQAFRFHQVKELDAIKASVDVLDLTGLPMSEVKTRVANLPDRSAVIYTTINVDGEGKAFLPTEALRQIAAAANRPVIVDIEGQVGAGATGGFVVLTRQIGEQAGLLAARLFKGESAASIPVTQIDAVRPVFDWRQLQRWNVEESRLPPGSEIRFRQLAIWEQYPWAIALAITLFFLQTASMLGLAYEDRRRRMAEARNQQLLGRLAHLNRIASAGELTASIAHEVRQPLAAIVASGAAGLNWLKGQTPNVAEAQAALQKIVSEVHRADDVIKNVRAMFRKEAPQRTAVNLNDSIKQVLALTARRISSDNVNLTVEYADPPPIALCNSVQIQQVLLNLVMNSLEAMASMPRDERRLSVSSYVRNASQVAIVVEDTGHAVAPDQIDGIFNPFVTTKPGGMGLGLAICKSIIEAHGGKISARLGREQGMSFEIALPRHGSWTHEPAYEPEQGTAGLRSGA
jgi:signal transduction histidine kinase